MTMYQGGIIKEENKIKRVYLGIVNIRADHSLAFLNNYTQGTSYCEEIEVSTNKSYPLNNRLGLNNLTLQIFFKSTANTGFIKSDLYYPIDQNMLNKDNILYYGGSFYFNHKHIIPYTGTRGVFAIKKNDDKAILTNGIYHILVSRGF